MVLICLHSQLINDERSDYIVAESFVDSYIHNCED